jgi:hypothetical protein
MELVLKTMPINMTRDRWFDLYFPLHLTWKSFGGFNGKNTGKIP